MNDQVSNQDGLRAEFETALKELRDLYDPSLPIDERKMLLAIRKELNRLLGLYCRTLERDGDSAGPDESPELIEVLDHLGPLGLAPEGTSAGELARLAAIKITQL